MNKIKSPFKFLDAYTLKDRATFFGRDKEIEQLYSLVFKTPLLMVYGASGTGKTSLVQCGLASKFDGTDWLPLWIRREGNFNDNLKNGLESALPTNVKSGSIPDNIKTLYRHYLRPVFLIFDQFEELFVFGKPNESNQFITHIKEVLDQELPCNIIIIVREEYLGNLYPFEKEVPELFDFRLRIEPMDTMRVKDVLTKSFSQFNIEIKKPKEEKLERIITNVSREKSGIELPYLQVYLDRLYREDFLRTYPSVTNNKDGIGHWRPIEFTLKEINDFGTIDTVLDKFLDEQLEEIQLDLTSIDDSVDKNTVRLLLDIFVSTEGTKRPLPYKREEDQILLYSIEEELPSITSNLLTYCLTAFEEARLIRSDAQTIELAHDSLAAIIDKRRTNEQRQLNDIKRQIGSMHQNFSSTGEYLTAKQIMVFEDFLPLLNLNTDLSQFYKESQDVRKFEENTELTKAKQQAAHERQLKEQAEAERKIAENAREDADKQASVALSAKLLAEEKRKEAEESERRAGKRFLAAILLGLIATFFAVKATTLTYELKTSLASEELAKKDAQNQAIIARSAKLEAEEDRKEAVKAREDADKQASVARSAKLEAEEDRKEAVKAKQIALEQAEIADSASLVAEEKKQEAIEANREAEKQATIVQLKNTDLIKANEGLVLNLLKESKEEFRKGNYSLSLDKLRDAGKFTVMKKETRFALDTFDTNANSTLYSLIENREYEKTKTLLNIFENESFDYKEEIFVKNIEKINSLLILRMEYDLVATILDLLNREQIINENIFSFIYELSYFYNESKNEQLSNKYYQYANKMKGLAASNEVLSSITNSRKKLKELDQELYSQMEMRYYPEMIKINGGMYEMGCKNNEDCFENNLQTRLLKINNFEIARTETTCWQFNLYQVATNKKKLNQNNWESHGNRPVILINWYEAIKYANWISTQKGFNNSLVYEIDTIENIILKANLENKSYRLPTEAEWEYAASGGMESKNFKYAGSNNLNEVGWFSNNSNNQEQPVGKKLPNELGISDMSGNVWEWCWDGFLNKNFDYPLKYTKGKVRNFEFQVLRGGSWLVDVKDSSIYKRISSSPKNQLSDVGFRLAQTN